MNGSTDRCRIFPTSLLVRAGWLGITGGYHNQRNTHIKFANGFGGPKNVQSDPTAASKHFKPDVRAPSGSKTTKVWDSDTIGEIPRDPPRDVICPDNRLIVKF